MPLDMSFFGILRFPLLLMQWVEEHIFLTFIIIIVGMSIYHFWGISLPLVLWEGIKNIIF